MNFHFGVSVSVQHNNKVFFFFHPSPSEETPTHGCVFHNSTSSPISFWPRPSPLFALSPKPPLLGVHPLEVIKCKDNSKSFSRDRLNDNFCDCVDGTDGLEVHHNSYFHLDVNDHFCDCCDGSDEYDGSVNFQHTCIMGGNIEYKTDHHFSRVGGLIGDLGHVGAKQAKSGVSLDDLIQKLKVFGCSSSSVPDLKEGVTAKSNSTFVILLLVFIPAMMADFLMGSSSM
ncbi:glucosidase 2 subunit beta [Prunus yedoensis var. nudiflora]|uniref:Glucosidase 2 subunit beta n=1 Tax=Prunus yedoensis var. nudiflora TaxID=2094558 RepID=A0A314ZGS3_PRUYE|nr:glucosidase 2 subunit beta [Prunus yedoensis var. nudiflora]